jgi:hypothetical protein
MTVPCRGKRVITLVRHLTSSDQREKCKQDTVQVSCHAEKRVWLVNSILLKKKKNYPYLNQQKHLFLPIIAYTLSTTKLEIRAK